MISLAFLASCFGLAVGLRYNLLILILAMLFIGTAVTVFAFALGSSFLNLVLTVALVFSALQVGFIGGAMGRQRNRLYGAGVPQDRPQLGRPAR